MNKILMIIALYSFFGVNHAQTNKISDYKEVKAKVDLAELWLNEIVTYYKLPGIAFGIIYDQELVYSNGVGFSDLEKRTKFGENTLFRIASITKTFTGTAIMQLRDKGLLNLDDPVKKYLKWFDIKNPFEDSPEVTIRQILTHTSGLPREAAFPYWTDREFPTDEQLINTLPGQSMIFEPETKWKYSNLAIALLGYIIEEVSGMNYDDYMRENIFTPIGMNSTFTQIKPGADERLAQGYWRADENGIRQIAPFTDSKAITPAANITTNIIDLAKYCSFQFKEDINKDFSVLKGSTLREMHRVQWLQPNWGSGWGLAFSVSKDDEQTFIGHGGWVGGYRSQLLFNTEDKIGVIVFINAEDYSPYTAASRIYKMVKPALISAFKTKEEEYIFSPAWHNLTGKYSDPSGWLTEVIILNEKLYFYNHSLPPGTNPESNLELLHPESENVFRLKDGNGEKVVFEIENGKVKQIKSGENFIFPVN